MTLFKMSARVSNAQPCSFQTRVHCPLNYFEVFSYVSSSIRDPMQQALSRVYFAPVGHLSH
jgi:hypothetical protein